jgi:hypothetical protein
MGHTKPEMLADIAKELDVIRRLEGIKERSPGVFYYKSIAFLHFHDKDGERWADVKSLRGYRKVDIEFRADRGARRKFVESVKGAHALLAEGPIALRPKRPGRSRRASAR